MKLSDFVCFDSTVAQLQSNNRDEAITELANSLAESGKIPKTKSAVIAKAVIERENEASTGIGKGVAVPHVKHSLIKDVIAVIGGSVEGIDFSSLDKQPAYSVILLLSPENNPDRHLQAMETIFKNLQKEDFRKFLRQSKNSDQIKETIKDADEQAI